MRADDERWMRLAIAVAAAAQGSTGDNPWVGCVIVSAGGVLLGQGHTQGPGEDHAEIAAARDAQARGHSVAGTTLYSTLEPCAFHGRTPACARSIAERGVARVVIGMRDPHPRVNGAGIAILQAARVAVTEGICEAEVRRQLGPWVVEHHPGDVVLRAATWLRETGSQQDTAPQDGVEQALASLYGVSPEQIRGVLNGE